MKSKFSRKGENVTGEGGTFVRTLARTFLKKKEKKKSREPCRLGRLLGFMLQVLLQAPLSTRINFHDIQSVVSDVAGIASLSLATLKSSDFEIRCLFGP